MPAKLKSRASRRGRVVILTLLGLLALFVAHVALWRPLDLSGQALSDGFTRVSGVIHVHTVHSDGGGTVDEVVQAARLSGVDFVIVTDHNNLDAKPKEGYHGPVMLLVGTEISTTAGYVLGLGIPDPVYRFSGGAQDALNDIRDLGGVSFAAHPTSSRAEFAWRGWDLPGNWGLEILNLDCQWRAASKARLLRTAALYAVNSRYALLSALTRPASVLEHWDALLEKRHAPGIVASDAHSRIALTTDRALRLPSYESLFAIAHNHVLLERPLSGEFRSDSLAILDALAKGRAYVGLDALAPANAFFFEAVAGARRWTMGETVPAELRPRLRAGGRLPEGARIVLLHNGQPLVESVAGVECQVPGPGVYRVEVYAPGWTVPWILSNPIYVFGATEAAARASRSLVPSEPAVPSATRILDDFEGRTIFRPEFDASSSMDLDVLDLTAPWQGKCSGRMSFRLGNANGGGHNASCALVSRERRDWTGASGLVFAIRGDGEYRVRVQIRDENPVARDEGCETWFASVKASRAWQRVAIPFSRFRSTDPKSDGHLDLDKIRLVAFVVDKGADKIGTEGTIWFDEIGLY